MRVLNFFWSTQQTKLLKTARALRESHHPRNRIRVVGFDLPAGVSRRTGEVTCPYAGDCFDWCYARQGYYRQRRIWDHYERNFELATQILKGSSFHRLGLALLADVLRLRATHVRLHSSGDFFCTKYVQAWGYVVARVPNLTLYGYTKSVSLLGFDLQSGGMWSMDHEHQWRLAASLGGIKDHLVNLEQPHSRVFATHAERKAAGYVDATKSDLPLIEGRVRLGLVYHGSRKLNASELVSLRSPKVRDAHV